jgi:hypothetical protein
MGLVHYLKNIFQAAPRGEHNCDWLLYVLDRRGIDLKILRQYDALAKVLPAAVSDYYGTKQLKFQIRLQVMPSWFVALRFTQDLQGKFAPASLVGLLHALTSDFGTPISLDLNDLAYVSEPGTVTAFRRYLQQVVWVDAALRAMAVHLPDAAIKRMKKHPPKWQFGMATDIRGMAQAEVLTDFTRYSRQRYCGDTMLDDIFAMGAVFAALLPEYASKTHVRPEKPQARYWQPTNALRKAAASLLLMTEAVLQESATHQEFQITELAAWCGEYAPAPSTTLWSCDVDACPA